MRNSSGRLIIQPDWNVALREEPNKVWISYKNPGSPTRHGEIKLSGQAADSGEQNFQCSENFSAQQSESRRITAKYLSDENYCLTTFQAPLVNFSSIHHGGKSIEALDTSPGGLGVSCNSQGKLLVWETDSGDVRRQLEGHIGDIYCCKFFPSGVVILTGGSDMMIKIWSAETGKCAVTCYGHRAAITDFGIIDRGRNILSCSKDGTAKIFDCGTQQCVLTFDHLESGTVNGCALTSSDAINLGPVAANRSPQEFGTDGKVVAFAGENGKLSVFSIQSRDKIFNTNCDSAINCCKFVDSTQLSCGTQDGKLYFWDIRQLASPLKIVNDGRAAILSLSHCRNGLLVSTNDGSCFTVKNNFTTGIEYTGVDCDPIYKVVHDDRYIYTACRDGIIRKYSMI